MIDKEKELFMEEKKPRKCEAKTKYEKLENCIRKKSPEERNDVGIKAQLRLKLLLTKRDELGEELLKIGGCAHTRALFNEWEKLIAIESKIVSLCLEG